MRPHPKFHWVVLAACGLATAALLTQASGKSGEGLAKASGIVESESSHAKQILDRTIAQYQIAAPEMLSSMDPKALLALTAGRSTAVAEASDSWSAPRAERRPALGASSVAFVEREGNWLRPKLCDGQRGQVEVRLPDRATEPFELRDDRSGLALGVRLLGIQPAKAEVSGGYVVYPEVHPSGGELIHRVHAGGTEDYLTFASAPPASEVKYEVRLGPSVAGVRLVSATLEFLDRQGAPRLRMEQPYLVDVKGTVRLADVAVRGCAFDASAAAPWNRPVTSPGSKTCLVTIAWDRSSIVYPAMLDPAWTTTLGSPAHKRQMASAVPLADGTVLIIGGGNITEGFVGACEIYHPDTQTFATTGSLTTPRWGFPAVHLPATGDVLIAGGCAGGGSGSLGCPPGGGYTGKIERFHAGTWTEVASLATAVGNLSAALVQGGSHDGQVLIAGGSSGDGFTSEAKAYLFNPSDNTVTSVPDMPVSRQEHAMAADPTAGGRVLVASGYAYTPGGVGSSRDDRATSYEYDADAGAWSNSGDINASIRQSPKLIAVPDAGGANINQVLLAGGGDMLAEVHTFGTTVWAPAGAMNTLRFSSTATLLGNKNVLVTGGSFLESCPGAPSSCLQDDTAELWDPTTRTWTPTASLATGRAFHYAAAIAPAAGQNGVFVGGGYEIATAEVLALNADAASCAAAGECNSGFCVGGSCCAVACAPPAHMVAACASGAACSFTCAAGWADCDGLSSNGCEIDLTGIGNCGGCGAAALPAPNPAHVCSTNHLSGSACVAGLCTGTCDAGWGDCNGDKSAAGNGCESNLNLPTARTGGPTAVYSITAGGVTYPEGIANCGACGVSCDDGNGCSTDLCVPGAAVGSCRHFDRSRCATARCSGSYYTGDNEASLANQSACQGSDSDGDGLPDAWEIAGVNPYTGAANPAGIDINCDGVVEPVTDFAYPATELPSPSTKDVYLRIRAMGQKPGTGGPCASDADCAADASRPYCDLAGGQCSEEPATGHRPDPAAVDLLKSAFAARGITLHVDYNPLDPVIPHADRLRFSAGDACDPSEPAADYFLSVKTAPHWDAKLQYSHRYAVFGHQWCVTTPEGDSSGVAEILGNDMVVTLGDTPFHFSGSDRIRMEGGTLLHELGHSLGLEHQIPARAPNYVSVMNYRYQFTGISTVDTPVSDPPTVTATTPRLDFSGFALPTLDEAHLNENVVLGPGSNDAVTFNCPTGIPRRGWAGGAINWNCNGVTGGATETDTAVNVDGSLPLVYDLHPGREDWSRLAYRYQCQPSFADGAALPPASVANDEVTIQEAIAHHELLPILDVRIDVRNGCSSNWIFLGSKGAVSVTLFGSAAFDVGQVVLASLDFAGAKPISSVLTDMNGDGFLDGNVQFRQSDLNLTPASHLATLSGLLASGQAFQGSDSVNVSAGPQPKRAGICPTLN